eukprot:CAMPEP_0118851420 /NCGR_PEP_ID=MMETSP1163-20130328/877_1 /TAXON_ID=124430 /ORGANISM="Phaeomonas parva, Strain CCMP2877" /LENGTH=499 /DNA_ID=CAMNT_0006783767 /DNA_START=168 /DNA_END=1667 /DNA_ORIENTATION=+
MRVLLQAIAAMLVLVSLASFLISSTPPAPKPHPAFPGPNATKKMSPPVHVAQPGQKFGEPIAINSPDDDARPEEEIVNGSGEFPLFSPEYSKPHAHIIFSTDCSSYQNWQSEFLAWSAVRVGHQGPVTRIASNCDDDEKAKLQARYEDLDVGGLRVHFADQSALMGNNNYYKYFNKPSGLLHWLKNDARLHGNEVIALLDPDMILMKPFQAHISPERDFTRTIENGIYTPDDAPRRTVDGRPVGAAYGLGAKWLEFKRDYICGPGSPCVSDWDDAGPKTKEAVAKFAVGPPYMATRNDFVKISHYWTDFCPKLYEEFATLLTEMYAYCLAAAHLQLPHFTVTNWMVSEPDMETREAWPEVEEIIDSEDFVCDESILTIHERHPQSPNILHYCQRYVIAQDQIWSKHRIPHDIFSCEAPMLRPPPSNALDFTPGLDADSRPLSTRLFRRNTFMTCYATYAMNDALTRFKKANCGDEANYEQVYLPLRHGADCRGDPNCHN